MKTENTLDRRDFAKAMAVGMWVAALPAIRAQHPPAQASQGPKNIKIGCSTLAWNVSPNSIDNFEMALKDTSELGYWSFETVSAMIEALDKDGTLARLIEKYQLPMKAGYMDVNVTDPVWSKYSNLLKPQVMALPAPNGLWKTLRANSGPCNVMLRPFRSSSLGRHVQPATMIGFKQIEFFDHTAWINHPENSTCRLCSAIRWPRWTSYQQLVPGFGKTSPCELSRSSHNSNSRSV